MHRDTVARSICSLMLVIAASCQRESVDRRTNMSEESEADGVVGSSLFAPDGTGNSITKPCPDRTGQPLPWEGSGACNGNLLVRVPLPTAKVELYFNSLRTGYRFCGGNRWSFSTERFVVSLGNDRFGVVDGDGSLTNFKKFGGGTTYFADTALISRNSLYRASSRSTFVEQSPSGTKHIYKATATRGAYPLQSTSDRNGNTATYTLNSSGCVTALKLTTGETIKFAYDSSKRLTTVSDAAGRKYNLRYSSTHDLVQVSLPDGRTWDFTYDSTTGNLITTKSALGEVNQYFYVGATGVLSASVNHNNWTTKRTYAGNSVNTSTAFDYVKEVFTNGHLTTVENNGALQLLTLDSDLRITETEGPTGTKTQVAYPGSVSAARANVFPIKVIQSDGKITELTYDAVFNVTRVKITKSGVTTTIDRVFDNFGLLLKETIGGKSTQYERDSRGNLLGTIDPNGLKVWKGLYDSSGNLISQTNEFNQTTSYTYTNNRLTKVIDPLGRATTFGYLADGLVSQISDFSGLETKFTYDPVGILRSTTKFATNQPSRTIGASIAVSYDQSGKVTSMQSDSLVNGAALAQDNQQFDPNGGLFDKLRKTSQGLTTEEVVNGAYVKVINSNPIPAVQP